MTSVASVQAGAKLFHKNIPGYAPPDPVYETYIGEEGEEKKQTVWAGPLRFRPRWVNNVSTTPERNTHRLVRTGHPDLAEREAQRPHA